MKTVVHILSVFFVVLAFTSCSNTDYQNTIPASASVVVKLDLKSIAEKGELGQSQSLQKLENYLKLVVAEKDMKKVGSYIDDPMSIGIDFSLPAFFFQFDSEAYGLTFKVRDDADLKDFLLLLQKQGLASKPVERNGLMTGSLVGGDIGYYYDANTLLLLSSEGGAPSQVRMAQVLMNQKESDSFVSTEAFGKMEDCTDDMVCYARFSALPTSVSVPMTIFCALPSKARPSEVEILAQARFEAGRALMTVQWWGNNEKAQKHIADVSKRLMPVQGRFITLAQDDLLAWCSLGAQGNWLLKQLQSLGDIKEKLFLLERAIDIELMLKSIKGDVAVAFSSQVLNQHPDAFVLHAQLANTNFLEDIDYWTVSMKDYGMSMERLEGNHFALHADGHTWHWGVNGNDFFYAGEEAPLQSEGSKNTFLNAHEQDVMNSLLYFYLNVEQLKAQGLVSPSTSAFPLSHAFDVLQSVVVRHTLDGQLVVEVEAKDKQMNILKQLL